MFFGFRLGFGGFFAYLTVETKSNLPCSILSKDVKVFKPLLTYAKGEVYCGQMI